MKRLKEILLLLGLILVVSLLSLTLCFPAPFTYGSGNPFIHYIRLLFCDKIFLAALINTYRVPFISSADLISFSFIILKNKIKFTRKSFYLTAFITSFILSAIYFIASAALNSISGYIFFPVQISLFYLLVLWIIELIADIVKKIRSKGKSNE